MKGPPSLPKSTRLVQEIPLVFPDLQNFIMLLYGSIFARSRDTVRSSTYNNLKASGLGLRRAETDSYDSAIFIFIFTWFTGIFLSSRNHGPW